MKVPVIFLMLLFVISCNNPDNEIIEVDFEKITGDEFTLSFIADDISYIPLDNNYPMSIYFQRAEIFNDTIFLNEKDNGLFALDMSGKMVRKYGSRGRGPGEYVYGNRYTIDRTGRVLYLIDQNRILKYSMDGPWLGNISLEQYPGHFTDLRFRDSLIMVFEFISYGEAVYDWIVIDTGGKLIGEKYNYVPSFKTNHGGPGGTYEYDNNIYYWNHINDTVYSVSPDFTYKTSLLFIPGKIRWPRSDQPIISISELKKYVNQFVTLNLILETDRFIVLRYFYKNGAMVLIDKSIRKSYKTTLDGNNEGLFNDLDGGASFEPKQYYKEGGREYLVGYTQPVDILTRLHSDNFKNYAPVYPEKKEALVRMAENIKETDNTLLTIVRLKK